MYMPIEYKESFAVRLCFNLILLTQCYLVFFQLFSDTIRFLVLVGLWAIFFILSLGKFTLKATIIRAIIYSIPTSFYNIMGTDYGTLPISFFNLFSLLLLMVVMAKWIVRKTIRIKKPLIAYLLFGLMILLIIPTAYSFDIFNATKQYMNVVLFCILTLTALVTFVPPGIVNKLTKDYLGVAIVTTVGLVTQIIVYKSMGAAYGKLDVMGGMRTAYGFLFSDYSFLSLYLSSAALLTVTLMLYNRKLNLSLIFCSVFLVYGSILTTARTGMVALLCALVFYGVIMFVRRPLITLSIMVALVLASGFYLDYSTHQRQDLISSSGRLAGYSVGIEELKNKPLSGTGLGVQAYKERFGIAIPHNIIIQYSVQGGLFSGLIVILLLITLLVVVYKDAHVLFLPIATVIIGAQFIPDIFNSRFFPVMLMLSLISIGYPRRQEVNVIENSSALIVK